MAQAATNRSSSMVFPIRDYSSLPEMQGQYSPPERNHFRPSIFGPGGGGGGGNGAGGHGKPLLRISSKAASKALSRSPFCGSLGSIGFSGGDGGIGIGTLTGPFFTQITMYLFGFFRSLSHCSSSSACSLQSAFLFLARFICSSRSLSYSE